MQPEVRNTSYQLINSLLVQSMHNLEVRNTSYQFHSFFFFFFFSQAWELFHDITHFLKQYIFLPLFPIVLVTNLVTPITCQHLPNLISGHCQKFFSQNFNLTLLGNYIWLLNFLFNPSCIATDQYSHSITILSAYISVSSHIEKGDTLTPFLCSHITIFVSSFFVCNHPYLLLS